MITRYTVLVAIVLVIGAGPIHGCRTESKPESFQTALMTAQMHAKSSMFSTVDARNLNGYLKEAGIPDSEREMRYRAVARAVVESGNVMWLIEFKRLKTDGTLGCFQLEAVWHFVSAHPATFFENVDENDAFASELNNPELAFSTNAEAIACLDQIKGYLEVAKDEKRKRLIQEWLDSLQALLQE